MGISWLSVLGCSHTLPHPLPTQKKLHHPYHTMTMDYLRFAAVSGEQPQPAGKFGRCEPKRDKRLERNRESARKCRKKRKAYVGDLEGKCNGLEDENAMLQLENDQLRELLQQLQNGTGIPESPRKRVKSEFGVSMVNDFSESAAHANQQSQLENFSQLTIFTTFLLLSAMLTATTTHLVPYLVTQAQVALQPPALVAPPHVAKLMDLPCDQRASRQRSFIVI